jgi:hypothetical protein
MLGPARVMMGVAGGPHLRSGSFGCVHAEARMPHADTRQPPASRLENNVDRRREGLPPFPGTPSCLPATRTAAHKQLVGPAGTIFTWETNYQSTR